MRTISVKKKLKDLSKHKVEGKTAYKVHDLRETFGIDPMRIYHARTRGKHIRAAGRGLIYHGEDLVDWLTWAVNTPPSFGKWYKQ